MASATFSNALLPLAGTDAAATREAKKPGFWARFYARLIEARMRAAEREIARHVRVKEFRRIGDINVAKRDLPFNV